MIVQLQSLIKVSEKISSNRINHNIFENLGILRFPGSSDEGESTSGATGGGGSGENAEMEENGSTRTSSNSSSNLPVYSDLKSLQAGGAHEIPQDYNSQSRSAYQQHGYSPGMDRQRNYEKDHQPSPSFKEEEKKSSWDYNEKTTRKEYSRSRDYSNEYRECCTSAEKNIETCHILKCLRLNLLLNLLIQLMES